MANNSRRPIVNFFRSKQKFAIAEAVLLALSVYFFSLEEGYWVFSSFLGILTALFYIGINYDKLFLKKQNKQGSNVFNDELFYELERISQSTENSIKNIDEIKQDIIKVTESLENSKNKI